jgi:hypothetical protein
MPHPDRRNETVTAWASARHQVGVPDADRPAMYFVVWGWSRRATQQGVVGPFTCGRCQWSGTFWLLAVERRFRLYWIPVGPWRIRRHALVCRNCGHAADVPRHAAPGLVDSAQPVLTAGPFGPQAAVAAAVPPVG